MSKETATPEMVKPEKIQQLVSKRLKSLRAYRGMSRTKAEAASGVKWDAIRRLEEINQTASIETVFRLCKAYGVSPADIIAPVFSAEM